jgi:hypothetical protein
MYAPPLLHTIHNNVSLEGILYPLFHPSIYPPKPQDYLYPNITTQNDSLNEYNENLKTKPGNNVPLGQIQKNISYF